MKFSELVDKIENYFTFKIVALILISSLGFVANLQELFDLPEHIMRWILLGLTLLGVAIAFFLGIREYRQKPKAWEPYGFLDLSVAAVLCTGTLTGMTYLAVSSSQANKCPRVTLKASSQLLEAGDTIRLIAHAVDTEQDPLSYRWSAVFADGPDASSSLGVDSVPCVLKETTFAAPAVLETSRSVRISVEVDDGACGDKVVKTTRIRLIPHVSTRTAVPTGTLTASIVPSRDPHQATKAAPTESVTPTATQTYTVMPTSTQVSIPRSTATAMPKPTDTKAPTPIPAATAIQKPTPTPAVTLLPTFTPLPTPTPTFSYLTQWPQHLEPDPNDTVARDKPVGIRWNWSTELKSDEYFSVRIWRSEGPEDEHCIHARVSKRWYEFDRNSELASSRCPGVNKFCWNVQVVKRNPNPPPSWIELSQNSRPTCFSIEQEREQPPHP